MRCRAWRREARLAWRAGGETPRVRQLTHFPGELEVVDRLLERRPVLVPDLRRPHPGGVHGQHPLLGLRVGNQRHCTQRDREQLRLHARGRVYSGGDPVTIARHCAESNGSAGIASLRVARRWDGKGHRGGEVAPGRGDHGLDDTTATTAAVCRIQRAGWEVSGCGHQCVQPRLLFLPQRRDAQSPPGAARRATGAVDGGAAADLQRVVSTRG